MPKNTKKPLLKESTVRRMFKLANIESVGNGFLSERFTTEEQIEENVEQADPPPPPRKPRPAKVAQLMRPQQRRIRQRRRN